MKKILLSISLILFIIPEVLVSPLLRVLIYFFSSGKSIFTNTLFFSPDVSIGIINKMILVQFLGALVIGIILCPLKFRGSRFLPILAGFLFFLAAFFDGFLYVVVNSFSNIQIG
jgi:hypothetical protein